jgi:NADH dehydrogenase (ubiquinone) 1 beta subcomplex subunit 7
MGNGIALAHKPEVTPPPYCKPNFDPLLGFENGRKQRGKEFSVAKMSSALHFVYLFLEMLVSEEEMVSAKLPLEQRDYCAHLAIKLLQCRREVWPWAWKCQPEKHEYLNCQYAE